VESVFYHLAYGLVHGRRSSESFEEVYERPRFALDYLGIDHRRNALADPLIMAALCSSSGSA
jgi:hypothetical protein